MKKNDFVKIKVLDIPALLEMAKNLKVEMANLVMDKNMNKLKDTKSIFKKRKDLAQVLTVLRQKQLLENLESKVKESNIEEVKSKKEKTEKGGKRQKVVLDNSAV